MRKGLNIQRVRIIREALSQLPREYVESEFEGKNGEILASDEAEAWKRVINYKLVKYKKPSTILETHTGAGYGKKLMLMAHPEAKITSLTHFQTQIPKGQMFDFIDIDPFGFPYEALFLVNHMLKENGVLAITSGEVCSITRKLGNSFLKTQYTGAQAWKFVEHDYIPYLEDYTKLKCQFFYAYPTSVRVILSNEKLPDFIFEGCPKWMWWFEKQKSLSEIKGLLW
jgi:hypothetical protein